MVKSFEWCKKSAESGNIIAQNRLALNYELGIGVQRDLEQSFFWYLKSAESGNVSAQFNVSIAYEEAEGTHMDLEKSLFWAEKAANANDFQSCLRAGRLYKNEIGIKINLEKSYYYFLQATKSKDERVLSVAHKEVKEFQMKGLTKLAHFHFEKMYLMLSYDHERIGKFNDVSFYFQKLK
jgi:TPR repeat protein